MGCESRGNTHSMLGEQHWPLLNGVATVFVSVPPIVLCLRHVIVYAHQQVLTWASVCRWFAFLFAHRIAFVSECMHIWLCSKERSSLLEEARGGKTGGLVWRAQSCCCS